MKPAAALSSALQLVPSGRVAAHRYILLAAILPLALSALNGQESPHWKTGPRLETQLAQPFSVQWHERPLRQVLGRLAQESEAAVFLDRRIDPDQPVTLTTDDLPLSELWERLAAAANAGTCRVGAVTYIGPPRTAARLAAVAGERRKDAGKLPAELRGRVLAQAPLKWRELAEPRALVTELAREAGLSVPNSESVPHDLWAAGDLPPLAWTDRLTLLLAGFDLTFELEAAAKTVRLVPLPATSPSPAASARKPPGKTQAKPGRSVYSLRAEGQPTGSVLKTIANSLGKELTYDPALVEKLRRPAEFDVKGVPLEELLGTALKPSGLSYELTDRELRITGPP